MRSRETIVDSFTRTIFVQAYASFVEELIEAGESVEDLPRAGAGEDWMDCAPETPDAVIALALEAITRIERSLNRHVDQLYEKACKACARPGARCNKFRHNEEEFGHCLAMQYVGHGVAWDDDHEMALDLPHGEFSLCSRAECGLPEVDDTSGGYCDCACRDCFDVAIGKAGKALCNECAEAGCEADGEHECQRDDAYSDGEPE